MSVFANTLRAALALLAVGLALGQVIAIADLVLL